MLQASAAAPPPSTVVEPATPQQATEVIPMTGIREIIAERMTLSVQTNASVTLHTEVDATAFVELNEQTPSERNKPYLYRSACESRR